MAARPEILFPLFADLKGLPGIGAKTEGLFEKLGVFKPRDLIFTLPHSGIDRRPVASVLDVPLPRVVTVEIEVTLHQPAKSRGRPYRVMVRDAKSEFQLVFFHPNPEWLRKQLPMGQRRVVSGKVELFDGMAQMVHPDHILPPEEAGELPEFEPVYPLTAGLTQKAMAKAVAGALERVPELGEWIEPSLLAEKRWPRWHEAMAAAHGPQSVQDVSPMAVARQRLAYDELLSHQVTLALARARLKKAKGLSSVGDGRLRDKVLAALPFEPTGAQLRSVTEIADDLADPYRMSRLLQGDVGAGKTLVALMAMLVVVEAGGQAAMMAPTEILARQHYDGLRPLAAAAGVRLEVLTGRDRGAEREAKLADLAAGRIDIMVGTHSLFQKSVEFRDLRLAVVDEQHRFGVTQRMELAAKGRAVDMLVMTATPIPRSLALAQYGDMDVSILDEKPPGRKPIRTVMVSAARTEEVVAHLRDAVAKGQQAYWVCPLVGESELVELTAAKERHRVLRLALGEDAVGLVHGQMAGPEKDAVMASFACGETKVLVATTVIEVGVDVPNATIMVIEQAEHFGLAQLHQLRGRVGRGSAESTCLLLYDGPLGETARARLEILRETEDGFRIAEEDLRLRGIGDLLGVAQSGLPRFQIADLESQGDLMRAAQTDARMLLDGDPELTSKRGEAVRVLLYLMERERAIRMLSVG